METATRPIPQAVQALEERYERLPIDTIVPSKTNPRTHFDQAYLDQLAVSLAEKGVLEPILVRPTARARFEVVCGECRYRAAKLAELSHLPAIIRAYSDEQVLEIQLVENIHRRDLSALEQAKGYRALIDSNPTKHSAESIATRIGMSPAWVWDRMKLLDLVPEAKAILQHDRMTVGHAILIARLKPADQTRVIAASPRNGHEREGLWQNDYGALELDDEAAETKASNADPYRHLKPVSVRELEHWIHDHIRFDVAHMAKAVPLQFEQTAAKVDEAAAQPGRGKKIIPITHSYRVSDDARDDAERTYGSESWQRADGQEKSKTCEHSVLGVIVAGRGQGDTLEVCVAREKCLVHFGDVVRAKEKAAKLREQGKSTQAGKVERRQEQSWEVEQRKREVERKHWEGLRSAAVAAVAAKIKQQPLTDKVLQRALDIITNSTTDTKKLAAVLGGRVTAKTFARALEIVQVLGQDYSLERFRPVAKKYGVDLAKLEKSLTAEVVEPSGVKAKKGRAA